jgi:hypothetical protein
MRSSLFHKFQLFLFLWIGLSSWIMGQQKGNVPGQYTYTTSIFDSSFKKALYKGSLDISKHHLSGLFYLKRVSADSFRIAFSSELGMSYFDLEITRDKLIIHSCFPSLKRKSLLHLIENDFRLLLFADTKIRRIKCSRSTDPELFVFRVKSTRGSFIYTCDKNSGKISRIQSSRAIIGKTDLRIYDYGGLLPVKVHISNPTIHLHLHMTFLSN